MAEELLKSIKQLSKERGISQDIFYSAIEEALITVADKYFDHGADIHVEIDKDMGRSEVYCTKLVVKGVEDHLTEICWKEALKYDSKAREGDEIKIYLPGETLGRVA
ncbi:MAG: transcription termination/antitermination protein NusA, partial [Candidatus Aminicenantes bacterium]